MMNPDELLDDDVSDDKDILSDEDIEEEDEENPFDMGFHEEVETDF